MNDIKAQDLSFHYKKDQPVISQIDLVIYGKEITLLTGPNGSGKTTLAKLLMGILDPVSGQILLDERNVSKMSLGQIGMKIGYLFQNPEKQFFAPTVQDELAFILRAKGFEPAYINNKVNWLLDRFNLSHLKEDFPLRLSQGEKQRLALAAILVNDPGYLILDEPSTGLDKESKITLANELKKLYNQGIGMTIISHDWAFCKQFPSRILEMSRGRIVDDRRS